MNPVTGSNRPEKVKELLFEVAKKYSVDDQRV